VAVSAASAVRVAVVMVVAIGMRMSVIMPMIVSSMVVMPKRHHAD
jgi:hypothetical protein